MKKKLLNILMTLGLVLMPFASISASTFVPATLYKGYDRVAVHSKTEADSYFKSGYKLETLRLGVAIPTGVANFETSLLTPLSSTATTSMTLVKGTTDDGNSLNGLYGFVLDNGGSNQEYILANCVGIACSSLVRGISVETGNTSVSALKKEHRRGASVQITDHPLLITLARILGGFESTPGGLTFGTSTITGINSLVMGGNGTITGLATPLSSATSSVANVDYVNTTSVSGGVNAAEGVRGFVDLATRSQMANGSYSGASSSALVLQSKYASSSSSSTTTIPITKTNGKIDQGFLDLSESFTFTGTTTFTGGLVGTTKFGGNGSDGALNITSGTTNIDLGGAETVIKNYTSISITGTSSLTFSNPHANGTLIIIKSQGNVTVTSSAAKAISADGMGAAAGSIANGTFNVNPVGSNGNAGSYSGSSSATPGAAKAALDRTLFYRYSIAGKAIRVVPGGSGGTGGAGGANGGDTAGGAGGNGGGALVVECAGALNITGTISAKGLIGGTGHTASHAYKQGGGGGGGGGAGGTILFLYNALSANTATFSVGGGNGGAGGNGTDGGGGGGDSAGGGGGASGGVNIGNGGSGGAGGYDSGVGGAGGNGTGTDFGTGGTYGSTVTEAGGGGGGGGGAGGIANVILNTEF